MIHPPRFVASPQATLTLISWACLPFLLSTPSNGAGAPGFDEHVKPFLEKHCVACHGPDKEKGGVRLDRIGPINQTPEFANTWVEIRDQVLHYDMPPEDEPEPSEPDRLAFLNWIAEELQQAREAASRTGGKVVLRRLNRNEYGETLRQLLHLHPAIDTAKALPDDDTFHGFDNIGSALNISPVQMRAYLENAAEVLDLAFPDGQAPKSTKTRIVAMDALDYYHATDAVRAWKQKVNGTVIPKAEFERQKREVMDAVPKRDLARTINFGVAGRSYHPEGVTFHQMAQVRWNNRPPGIYRFRFHVRGIPNEDGDLPMLAVSLTARPPSVDQQIGTTDVGPEFQTYEMEAYALPHFSSLRFDVAAMGNKFYYRRGLQPPQVQVEWVEIEGPIVEHWPSKAWHAYFAGTTDSETSARSIIERFAEHAFRRPPRPERIDQFMAFYLQRRAQGDDFQAAIELVMRAILASPEFVFMLEEKTSDGKKQPLDDFELATRLSYFLWSGPPDEELYRLAKSGQLRSQLTAQVRRMIHHPRAARFSENFTGQWLKLRTLGQMAPDPRKYVEWEETLQDSMRRETESFFLHILQRDLPIAQFIDADFAMLNSRLAHFYGVEGVNGYEIRPVSLGPDATRGGLLAQGSILTLTSDGIRTSPVKRGTFILENLLGDPPPPPPNDVPPVEQSQGATLKERLKSHREIPACADCHNKIDPLGFALENFNAIGKWREKEEDTRQPVDPSGTMPSGENFANFRQFQQLLATRADDFTACLAEKLLMYALGRPVDFADETVIDSIVARTGQNGGTLSAMVEAIATSEPFLTK